MPEFAKDSAEILRMYRAMTLVRVFDAKAVNLQRTGQLGTYPSCLGHEAAHVGVGAAMRPEDVLAPVYREFGTQLWRGVTMTEILTYWGGDERGNDFAVPRHDFAWCVPIATQTLHAAGAAMAFKILKQPRCALAYIGDGGTSEGAFYEALNLAGARALPVVFVIVNNGWAISVPVAAQTAARTLAQKAVAAGIPGVQVDGNDVIAVRDVVVGEALDSRAAGRRPDVDRGADLSTERSHDRGRRQPLSLRPAKSRGMGPRTAVCARASSWSHEATGMTDKEAALLAGVRAQGRRGGRPNILAKLQTVDRCHVRASVRRAARALARTAR